MLKDSQTTIKMFPQAEWGYGCNGDCSRRRRRKKSGRKVDIKYCLSLQGGGKRGYATVTYLKLLEAKGINIYKKFDMFGGSSVGSMIAASLAVGMTASEISDKIMKVMRNPSTLEKSSTHNIPFTMKYTGKGKRRMIDEFIPPIDMNGDPLYRHQKKVNLKHLVVSAYRVSDAQTCYFTSGTKHSVRDVVDASSAAPTYFPPIDIDGKQYIDSGVSTNDISMFIYATARKMWPDSIIKILNIGTGRYRKRFEIGASPGMFEWAKNGLHHVMANASNDVSDFECRVLMEGDYYHVNTDMEEEISMDGTDSQDFYNLALMAHKWFMTYSRDNIDFLGE